VLCFTDARQSLEGAVAIADTCRIGVSVATIRPLSELDALELRVGYEALDFDPGAFVHSTYADGLWRRRFSRAAEGRAQAGAILAVDANPVSREGERIDLLPRGTLGLAWRLVNLRLFRLGFDLEAGVDGVAESISRRYLARARLASALGAVIRRDIDVSLQITALALGFDQSCPPRQTLGEDPHGGCSDDLTPDERRAELPALTSFISTLGLRWRLDEDLEVFAAGQYTLHGPHLSRLGTEPSDPGADTLGSQSIREISAQLGFRFAFGTNNDLGS
jgi:hypothetical protein